MTQKSYRVHAECPEYCAVQPDVKLFRGGTHRVCMPRESYDRISSWFTAFGVTRIANVTGLDYVGIPVAMAVRPNSLNLSVYQGKGISLDAAKASAAMEAYEYACAELPDVDRTWATRSAWDPAHHVVPPRLAQKRLAPDCVIPWVIATNLVTSKTVAVPEETVSTDFSAPPRRGFGFFRNSSNGLASGNTYDEAILHALCELIERDALALWKLTPPGHQAGTRIDPRRVADPAVHWLLDRYDTASMHVDVWEVTSDIGVPTYFCIIDDFNGRPPFLGRFGGAGCHPDSGVALCRALAEAAQSRLTFIVGTRDDISPDSYAGGGWHRSIANLIAGAGPSQQLTAREPHSISVAANTIAADIEAVLGKLVARGIKQVLQIDLTDPAVGIPCVRLLAPQLEGMSHKPGYRSGRRAQRMARAWA